MVRLLNTPGCRLPLDRQQKTFALKFRYRGEKFFAVPIYLVYCPSPISPEKVIRVSVPLMSSSRENLRR
jgi:hypothetical protein